MNDEQKAAAEALAGIPRGTRERVRSLTHYGEKEEFLLMDMPDTCGTVLKSIDGCDAELTQKLAEALGWKEPCDESTRPWKSGRIGYKRRIYNLDRGILFPWEPVRA